MTYVDCPTLCGTHGVACVQQAVSTLREARKSRPLNYIDLCSTANVSVFVLSTQRFGFYIHGQCVHDASDVDLAIWYDNFRAEKARPSVLHSIFLSVCLSVCLSVRPHARTPRARGLRSFF